MGSFFFERLEVQMCKAFARTVSLQSATAHGQAGSTMAGSSRMLPEAAGMGYTVAHSQLLKFESTAHGSSLSLTTLLLGALLRNGNHLCPFGDAVTWQTQWL